MTIKYFLEGRIPFEVPDAGKPCHTWYKIAGDLNSSITPLIAAHGGPGAAHEYLLPLVDLYEKYGIPVIFYDQVGCGRSTHLREKNGDETFWTIGLFIRELDNLIDHFKLREKGFHFLGQSWGGILGGEYAAGQPQGLCKLILADAPSSVPLLLDGENALIKKLPQTVQDALYEADRTGNYDSEEYKKACLVFYKRHLCRLDPWPKGVEQALGHLEEDPTVYNTMFGPSEITATGSLKNWEGYSKAHKIQVETLLINARYDEVQDIAIAPWFHRIPKVKWVRLENSSHMGHYEERERYMQLCGAFLGHEKTLANANQAV